MTSWLIFIIEKLDSLHFSGTYLEMILMLILNYFSVKRDQYSFSRASQNAWRVAGWRNETGWIDSHGLWSAASVQWRRYEIK